MKDKQERGAPQELVKTTHTPIKPNFAISNSLNMQKPQVKSTHFCPSDRNPPSGSSTLIIVTCVC